MPRLEEAAYKCNVTLNNKLNSSKKANLQIDQDQFFSPAVIQKTVFEN